MSDLISIEEEIARLEAEVKAKQSEINDLNRKIGKLQIQCRLAEIEGRQKNDIVVTEKQNCKGRRMLERGL